jgi:hypothetical protein
MRAFQQAGVQLPRTSRAQYMASPPVARDALQPGDLLFWAYDTSDPSSIHHVAIYLGQDSVGTPWMIDAPPHGRHDPGPPRLLDGRLHRSHPPAGHSLMYCRVRVEVNMSAWR